MAANDVPRCSLLLTRGWQCPVPTTIKNDATQQHDADGGAEVGEIVPDKEKYREEGGDQRKAPRDHIEGRHGQRPDLRSSGALGPNRFPGAKGPDAGIKRLQYRD